MASKLEIWNRALQLVGAKRVSSLEDTTASGRAVAACYDTLLDAELEKHCWNFATGRATLAAVTPAPEFGRSAEFVLPSDYICLLRPYPEQNGHHIDYVIEGKKIVTNLGAPLYIRYVKRVTDANSMPALFRESLSHSIAIGICEELTQSRSKKEGLEGSYKQVVALARRKNAFETVARMPPEDDWVTVRSGFNTMGNRPYEQE